MSSRWTIAATDGEFGRPPAFTLEDAADDVAALADALDIDRFVVAGYSMGGPIAQLVWRRHRERVSGLVMCATACQFRATPRERMMFAALPALEQMHRVLPDAVAKRVIAQISRSYLAETGYAAWARRELLLRDPRAVLQAAIELGKYAAGDWMGEIDVPTSVVIHTRDQVVPPRRQFELASAVPGASARFVGADHFAVVREPQRFVRTLVDAINDVAFDTFVDCRGPPGELMQRRTSKPARRTLRVPTLKRYGSRWACDSMSADDIRRRRSPRAGRHHVSGARQASRRRLVLSSFMLASFGSSRGDAHEARQPLRPEIGLRGEELVELLDVEGVAVVDFDGDHDAIADPFVGYRVHRDRADVRMACDDPFDRRRGEVLAVDAQPLVRSAREVEPAVFVAIREIA